QAWLRARGYPATPLRWLTRAESEAGQAGFITHARRDPARRTDPGADFPADEFLAACAAAIRPTTPPVPPPVPAEEEDVMHMSDAYSLRPGQGRQYVFDVNGAKKVRLTSGFGPSSGHLWWIGFRADGTTEYRVTGDAATSEFDWRLPGSNGVAEFAAPAGAVQMGLTHFGGPLTVKVVDDADVLATPPARPVT
ncbi:MAG: hypothetical protein ACRCZP_01940, partial [Phycicoccus sp.]